MAYSIEYEKYYCPTCKAERSTKKCPKCGKKTVGRGKISIRFRAFVNDVEKQLRLRGFLTQKEAEEAYKEYMRSYIPIHRESINAAHLTFDQAFDLYMSEHLKQNAKESTIVTVRYKFAQNIIPYFKNMAIGKIDKHDILTWQNILLSKGLAYKTIKTLRGHISSLFYFLIKYHDYSRNPVQSCPALKDPNQQKKDLMTWDESTFKQFIEQVQNETMRCFFLFSYYMGTRKGETLALQWKDIDFDSHYVAISKSLTRKTENGGYKITTPKNISSNRKILMPEDLCMNIKRLADNTPHEPQDFVFGGKKPLAESSIDRTKRNACVAASISEIRLHDFRHSHASLLISRGASIVLVSKRLGHSNIEQTLNTYSHLMPQEEHQLIKLL